MIRPAAFALAMALALPAHAGPADRAERYVGLREGTATINRLIRMNTKRLPWCAGFVRAMFSNPPTDSLAVAGWDSRAVGPVVAVPRRGDVAFWRHRHIGVVVAVKGDMVCTVSGNRGNKVARSCEPRRKFRKFRRVK